MDPFATRDSLYFIMSSEQHHKDKMKASHKTLPIEKHLDKHERPQESSEAGYLKGLIESSRAKLQNSDSMRLENKGVGELPHLTTFIFLRGTCLLLCPMSLTQAIDIEKTHSFPFLNLVTYCNSDASIYFQTLVNIIKVFLQRFGNEVKKIVYRKIFR